MPVDTESQQKSFYKVLASSIHTHSCKKRVVFGIKAEFIDESSKIFRIRDISANIKEVLRLIMLLNEYSVSEQHFFDVVEDFVQELYM